jgi:large subunit ribosomal protein L21
MLYAIISDGGRQLKVEEGQTLDIDFRDAVTGDQIKFDRVLALRTDEGLQVGQPVLGAVSVTAEVVGATPGPKLVIQKFRRRKNSRRRTGHRQIFTRVKINKIEVA